jgi:hypothetical protein
VDDDSHLIIGGSPALKQLLEQLDRLARAEKEPLVSLRGESGSGKEGLAHRVHQLSKRSGNVFVTVHCGAIPANTFESNFFGHVKGAFSDAKADHAGFFRAADGGTIFLDEVGELPYDLQAKLLRAFEGFIQPVGSNNERKVNVRIVAATNRDLSEAVRAGKFRADLLYRLGVPLEVPPLRDRGNDIMLLAKHFAGSRRFSDEARAMLMSYDWPGNVRQLKHVIERAAALADGDEISDAGLQLPTMTPASDEDEALLATFCDRGGVSEKAMTQVLIAAGAHPEQWEAILNRYSQRPRVILGALQRLAAQPREGGTTAEVTEDYSKIPFETCEHPEGLKPARASDPKAVVRKFPTGWRCPECLERAKQLVSASEQDKADLIALLSAAHQATSGSPLVPMEETAYVKSNSSFWTKIRAVPKEASLRDQLKAFGEKVATDRHNKAGRGGESDYREKLRTRNIECVVLAQLCEAPDDKECLESIKRFVGLATGARS